MQLLGLGQGDIRTPPKTTNVTPETPRRRSSDAQVPPKGPPEPPPTAPNQGPWLQTGVHGSKQGSVFNNAYIGLLSNRTLGKRQLCGFGHADPPRGELRATNVAPENPQGDLSFTNPFSQSVSQL